MSTIKVLHVIARMNVGGTAKYVGELVEHISESALATGLVQGAEIEYAAVENLPVYRVQHLGRKISPVDDFKAWRELRKLVKELKPQIIHTHTFKAGLIGRLISGNHKRVHTFHGHLFDDRSFSQLEKRVIAIIEKFLARRTDVFVSVGEKVGQELRAAGIGPSRKWVSIPPGVNPLPTVEKTEARSLLGLNQEQMLIGWMARMAEVKNPHLLLEVAKRLPNVHFVMAGGGELLQEVTRDAPSNVAVIGWVDASIFWSAVDCAISTSDNEGMPIALIEAQLSGIPVIATNVGSNKEVVEDGATGIVVDKGVDPLVNAINKILVKGPLLDQMSDRARSWAENRFSVLGMLERHKAIYAPLL